MIRACIIAIVIAITAVCCHAAQWDTTYSCSALPGAPFVLISSEVTNNTPVDTREILNSDILHIVDSSKNRTRYRVDFDYLYGSGTEAGILETRQKFVSSSDMNNIGLMMRQNTTDESAEIRTGYYDAGDGRRGLWNARTGDFLGVIDPTKYYKLRMILDGATGGRLYVNDSYYAKLTPGPGASTRITFGAGSILGTGEVYIDYVRWCHGVKAGPGMPGDPQDSWELISPRLTTLATATPGVNSATITWNTDVASDSTLHWGTQWNCSNTAYNASLATQHSMTISGLQPGETYYFSVESKVPADPDVAVSGIQKFTTEETFRMDSGPFVRTTTDGKSATISWNTTFDGDSKVFFRPVGVTGWFQKMSTAQTTSHAIALDNLTAGSAYEYYVVSTRSGSPDAQSQVQSFYTYVYANTGSLLNNGDFELGNVIGWTLATGGDAGIVHQGPWYESVMPHAGTYFLSSDSNGGARNGVVYQSVSNLPAGATVYATAWVHTYELNALGLEDHSSAFCQVGVDVTQTPGTNMNPNAATVRWSTPAFTANYGPWTCIGVAVPRGAGNYATIFLKQTQTADGGLNVTCFDDAVLTTTPSVNITSGPTITQNDATSTTIQWTTDVDSTSFVQFGPGTLGSYQFTDYYVDTTFSKTHLVTFPVIPATAYVYQVGSTSPSGMALAPPAAFTSPMNDKLENTGFEAKDAHGRPSVSPWTLFQYNINLIPRLAQGGQPAGGPIDGLVGSYPAGGSAWNGITCESNGGSYFLGAYASSANKNGGVYQKVKVTPGGTYKASMRFLTHQDPIDATHPASNTACAIGIDPTGGTNIQSSSIIWSTDATSSTDGAWDETFVRATASSNTITVFCIVEQQRADCVHLNAIDNVTLKLDTPASGSIGALKQQSTGSTVNINSAILTYANIPPTPGSVAQLYVEDTDRSSGILLRSNAPVLWTNPPQRGDTISAQGVISVVNGEAAVTTTSLTVTPGSVDNLPKPLTLTNKALCSGPFGLQPSILGGTIGIPSVGLRVKVFGRVTSGDMMSGGWITDSNGKYCIYVDDGSGLDTGFAWRGVKVIGDEIIMYYWYLNPGDMVSMVGVCSVEKTGNTIRPVILLYDWNDVQP